MTDRSKRPITPGKGDIYTFIDCPDGKFSLDVFGEDYKTDICFDMTLDGRNGYDCFELCTTGYQGLKCRRGYAR